MAEACQASVVTSATVEEKTSPHERSPTLVLKLKKPEPDKKVSWDESSAVDNEHMNKKKSKCCCIYEKPRKFGESDTESDDDDGDCCTEHCRGHRNKDYQKLPDAASHEASGSS